MLAIIWSYYYHKFYGAKKIVLTIECPKYSAALSEMYKSFPFCVIMMRKPLSAWNNGTNTFKLDDNGTVSNHKLNLSHCIIIKCLKGGIPHSPRTFILRKNVRAHLCKNTFWWCTTQWHEMEKNAFLSTLHREKQGWQEPIYSSREQIIMGCGFSHYQINVVRHLQIQIS